MTYDSAPTGSTTACAFGLGRLCAAQDESGITAFAYDPFGNLTQHTKTELGVTYTTRYTYDAGHRVLSMTYPDNRTITYARDTLGRIEAVTTTVNGTPQTIVANRTYRADGLLRSQTYGNGLTEVRDHDLRGQLIYQSLGSADTRVYGYDPNGNLTQQQRLPAVSNYGYDRLDRLASETDTQTTLGYTYDGNGNRVSASLNTLGATLNYEANTNRLTSLTMGSTTEPLTLDPAGNLTSLFNGRITLTYNNAGRLSALRSGTTTLARYTYNHLGQRTRKATGTTTVYHYDLNGNLIAETQPNGTPIRAYLYAEDLPLAQITKAATESLVYLHVDHPGTPRLATDATPRVVWRWEADAFGALPPNTDPDGDGKRTVINLRFAGQYFDGESGLYYNWNRYYSQALGRYITSDPFSVAEHVGLWQASLGIPGEPPLEINPFVYTANNPLTWIDLDGMKSTSAGGARSGGARSSGSRSGSAPSMSINERNKALLHLIELLDPPEKPPGCVISFEYECPNDPYDDGTQCLAYPRHEAWPAGHSKPRTCLKPRLVVRCR